MYSSTSTINCNLVVELTNFQSDYNLGKQEHPILRLDGSKLCMRLVQCTHIVAHTITHGYDKYTDIKKITKY